MIHDMIMAAAGASGPAAPSDADFENVTLLLHGDGTNGAQNNTFLDSSTNNFTITRNGNTTQGTFSPFSKVDGRWGNYFDGSGDYIQVADNAALELASESNWTVEFWGYFVSTPSDFDVILGKGTASGNYEYFFEAFSDRTIDILYSADGTTTWTGQHQLTGDLGLNQWFHFAAVRNGATFKSYVNGVEYFSGSSFNIYAGNGVLNIGGFSGSGTQDPNMYLSNVRIVKGTAVYTSNFTPPTAPLTAIANTSLLTCQSNRFKDNSSNNFTITRNGDVKVTPFSPFPTLTAYDAATNGGSGYFDGTGDSLSTASNSAFDFGTGSFTLECWFNKQGAGGSSDGVGNVLVYTGDGSNNATWLGITDSGTIIGKIAFNGSSWAAEISGGSVGNGSWNHVALVRNGSAVNLYLNGTSIANTTNSTNLSTFGTNSSIGVNYTSTRTFNGYIASARINKSAVYTTGFTPATSPFTAIANTSLLCNFTNAGIIDNSMSNNLETVGNAQIDTTTKKYGTGSMEFDGTGDWLTIANTPDLQLGTGNFTVEFWVYLATGDTGSNRGLVGKGGASTGWLVSLNTTQKVVFTYASSTITSSGAITTNAWNHIAVVREGTGSNQTKIYIGGTNDGTGTVSTDFNQTEIMYVGANRTGGDPMKGFIDDLRITKGKARYTTTFTPPTAALPDIGE